MAQGSMMICCTDYYFLTILFYVHVLLTERGDGGIIVEMKFCFGSCSQ